MPSDEEARRRGNATFQATEAPRRLCAGYPPPLFRAVTTYTGSVG